MSPYVSVELKLRAAWIESKISIDVVSVFDKTAVDLQEGLGKGKI